VARRSRASTERFAVFSCTHAPFTDPFADEWFCSVLKTYRPSILGCLGDLYESGAASKWSKEGAKRLSEEYESAAWLLRKYREVSRAKTLFWTMGNHDDNVMGVDRIPELVRDMCAPERHGVLGPEMARWKVIPYEYSERGCHRIGRVVFKHGFECGKFADRNEAIFFAKDAPGSLVIGGHTHRPVGVTQAEFNANTALPIWYANAGTLGPLKPDYVRRRNTSRWGHACVVGTITGDKWTAETRWKDVG